jgi:hypothetical protein
MSRHHFIDVGGDFRRLPSSEPFKLTSGDACPHWLTLAARRHTSANRSELLRMTCRYPLRHRHKRVEQVTFSG